MDEDFDYDFTDNLDSCFIVADSQEDQQSELNKSKLMETLSALTSPKTARRCELEVPFSPRRCDLPQTSGNSKPRKAAVSSSTGSDGDQQQQGEAPPQGGSGGAEGGGGGDGEEEGGGDNGGGGGGEGGGDDNPEEGEGQEVDDEDEDEEHVEEGTQSTPSGGSSGGTVPPFIAAQPGEHAVLVGVPEHVAFQQQLHEPPSNGHVMSHGGSSPLAGSPQGSGAGGISDATTAVVTDSDHHGTSDVTAAGQSGFHTSPGDVGLSPRGGVHDISSTHSTLSSWTSSSSDPQNTLRLAQRKRPPARRIHQQSKKQKLMDLSTTDTSGRDTSTTSKTDITTTTTTASTDTSHDDSRERSGHEPGSRPGEEDIGGSQEDLFDDNTSSHAPPGEGHSVSGPGGDVMGGGLMPSTPAKKLESLQFSCEPMIVPDTVPDNGSSEEIPPSQGVFSSQTPLMVPSSPTPLADRPSASQYEDASELCREEPRNADKSRPKSVHEWQPSYPGFESSSRSRSASVQVQQGSSGSLGTRSTCTESVANRPRSKVNRKGSRPEEPVESQDVEITGVEGGVSKKPAVSTGGDSMALNLHLADSERPATLHDPQQSIDDNSVILLEPEKTVINLETSSSEEQVQEIIDKDPAIAETSQQLALHLTQTQNEPSIPTINVAKSAARVLSQGKTSQSRDTQLSTPGFKLSVPTERNLQSSSHTAEAYKDGANKKQSQNEDPTSTGAPALLTAEDAVLVQPSLTLDMINTMHDSPPSQAFTLFRPMVSPSADLEESEKVTVFTKVKDSSPRKSAKSHVPGYTLAVTMAQPGSSLREQSQPNIHVMESGEGASARLRDMIRDKQTQEDSQVYQKRKKNKAKLLVESQEKDSVEEVQCNSRSQEISEKTWDSSPSEVIYEEGKARFETLLGQATLECEMDTEPTQDYEYTGDCGKVEKEAGEVPRRGQHRGRGRPPRRNSGGRGRGRRGCGKTVGGHSRVMEGRDVARMSPREGSYEDLGQSKEEDLVSSKGRGYISGGMEDTKAQFRKVYIHRGAEDTKTQSGRGAEDTKAQSGSGYTQRGMEDTKAQSGRGRGKSRRGRGRRYSSQNRGGHVTSGQGESVKGAGGNREQQEGKKEEEMMVCSPEGAGVKGTIDYKILHYKEETPRSRYVQSMEKKASVTSSSGEQTGGGSPGTRKKSVVESVDHRVTSATVGSQGQHPTVLSEPTQMKESLKISLVKKPTMKKTRKGKKPSASKKAKTPATPKSSRSVVGQSDVSHEEVQISGLRRLSATTPASSTGVPKLEHKTQSVQASSAQRIIHTMTTKTVYCRTETMVLDIMNGKVVGSNKSEKTEILSESTKHEEDPCDTPSPSRTAQTLTSGDLGDISSFTDSHGHSKSSSMNTPHLGRSRSTVGSRHSISSSRSLHKKSLSATTVAKSLSVDKTSDSTSVDLLEKKSVEERGAGGSVGNLERQSRPSLEQGIQGLVQGRGVESVLPVLGSRGTMIIDYSETSDIPLAQVARLVDTLSDTSKRTSEDHMGLGSWTEVDILGRGEKLKRQSSVGRKPQRFTTSDHGKESASLFSTSDDLEHQQSVVKTHSRKWSSGKNSESLFSAPASEADTQILSNSESVFVRPTTLPRGAKRYSSDSSRKSLGQSTTESEVIPPTDTEKIVGRKPVEYIRGAVNTSLNQTEKLLGEQQVIGSIVQTSETRPVSSGEKSDTDVVYLPPYRPTEPIQIGTRVMAMWKDKHYYPGYVQETTTEKARQIYAVQFDDGNRRKVKDTEVIVCDLLAIGQECMAITNTETGWSEVCLVVGHHRKGTEAHCIVQFDDRRKEKIQRSSLCLNQDHIKNLVTANLTLTSRGGGEEMEVVQGSSDHDIIPPSVQQEEGEETEEGTVRVLEVGLGGQRAKVGRGSGGRGGWRRKNFKGLTRLKDGTTEIKADVVPQVEHSETVEVEEEYFPEDARMSNTLGPLENGRAVFAQWRDKCYYPGFIKELDKKTTGRYLVTFEDGDGRSVHEEDLIVCEFLPVGMNVLVQKEEGGWSEPALVLGHWKRAEVKGYKVKYEDNTERRVERGAVNLSSEQAITFLREFLRPYSMPRPRLGDLSLENVVGGKRECTGPVSKPKATPKSPPKKRGLLPKTVEVEHLETAEVGEEYFPEDARMSNTLGPLENGRAVFAQWRDKCYYPGFIKELDKKTMGRYLVTFEDGDERSVHEEDLIVCEFLPVGMNVLVQKEEGGWSEPALVLGHWKRAEVKGYKVKYEDNTEGRVGRSAVSLNAEQAATFFVEYLRPHGTPRPRLGDLSLENVVGGKRERSVPVSPTTKPKTVVKSPTKKRGPQARFSTSQSQSTGQKKRKLGGIEPKYTSTPTPKRQAARVQIGEDSAVPSPVGTILDSPIQKKRTPTKSRHELFSSIKGPIPPTGSTLFQDYVCMLTHREKTDEQKQIEKPPELSTTDESLEVEQEQEVPFDKEHLTKQIEGGGGLVVEAFSTEHLTTRQCIVLSNCHQRTLKYLQCIALGKLCLSHIWVKDSCLTGSIQDHKAYTLPSGFCIETGRVLEMPEGVRPLRDCKMMVSSTNTRFISTWECIVEAAGARMCKSLPSTATEARKDPVLAVVSDGHVASSVVSQARELDIPVVSSEWLIQTLISGRIKGFNTHPRYNYTCITNSSSTTTAAP